MFVHHAVKEGIFTDFFQAQQQKESAAVDALFEEIFLDAFLSMDDELIDKSNYCRVVSNKLSDDEQLKNLLVR